MIVAISSMKSPRGEQKSWFKYGNSFVGTDAEPITLRNAVLEGRGFCSVHAHKSKVVNDPKTGETKVLSYRRIENWLESGFVALDFDHGDMSVAKFMDGSVDPWLGMHAAVVYSTRNSTIDVPRCRAVVPISEAYNNVDEYRKLCKALHAMYPTADPMMMNPIQPWAGNDNPRVDVMLDEANYLPKPAADMIIRQYEEKCAAEMRHMRMADPYSGNGAADLKVMAEALHAIPPQPGYMEWVKVLMAIYSVLPNEEGIRLAESWSPGRPGEVAEKFRSFQHGVSVGLGTLYYLAGQSGWRRQERSISIAGIISSAAAGKMQKPRGYRRY